MFLNLYKLRLGSIRTKIVLTTFITISAVLLLISSTLFFSFHTTLKESILRQQFLLVSEIAEQLNGRMELARLQLTLFSTVITSAVLADKEKIEHELTNASPVSLIFDAGFMVIGTNGLVMGESMESSDLINTDFSSREYVQRALTTGKPVISAPFQAPAPSRQAMIAMVVPVRDDNDRIICLLAGFHTLGTNKFLTGLSPKQVSAGGYLFIIQGRTILSHPDSARLLEVVPEGENRGMDLALQGFEGSLENINSKEQHMLSSFKRVGETGWIVGTNTPYDEAFAPLNKLERTAALIASVGILFSLLVLWYAASRVTRPITELSSHINAIGSDKLEWRPLTITTGDEIELLSDAFNRLMKEVQEAKQQLVDEKNFFGGIIENAAAPMFVIDRTHTIIFWNRALATLTGKSPLEMIGTKQQWLPFYAEKRPVLADLVIDHSSERLGELYDCYASSQFIEGSQRAEGWYDNVGGRRRYIFFEAAPVKNSANEIVAAIETVEDITDRKLAEEATANHNLFLQSVMDAIPNPVYYKNCAGAYLGCNTAFKSFFNKSAEEIIGRSVFDILPESYTRQSTQNDQFVIESASGVQYETAFARGDGTIRNILASKTPFTHVDGSIAGIVGAFMDITERKQVEAELARLFDQVAHAKEEWENTLDHLRDFIILADSDQRIRRCNKLLAENTGKPFAELIGRNWKELIDEAGFTFVTFNGTTGEIVNKRSLRSYDINVYPVTIAGQASGHVVSINDVTELRAAGRELEKAYSELKDAQMQIFQQEKMASIGQLAAGVAHEINNPMGFISSNLSTLNKYVDRLAEFIAVGDEALASAGSEATEKIKAARKRLKIDYVMEDSHQLIAESQDGAARVRRIVQDLKSFSHVDQAETARVNLNEALDTTINIAWNEIKYVATLNREFGEIPQVKCFPQQLNQVFLNLLVNAAHAIGDKQGSITVRTWSEADHVCVSVADSGCGIPEEIRQKIFEPFFTTKEVGKGTGLGLSISYDIIRKHGGEITVESEVGQGTTFTVRLPVDGPPQEPETTEII